MKSIPFALAALVAGPGAAIAQEVKAPASIAELDLSIPEAPGFAVIGLAPTKVIDPSVGRITAVDFANFMDEDGNLKQGLALSVSPYFWLQPGVTLDHYQSATWFERIIARTQVSAGFAEGGDGKQDSIGVGMTTELLGNGDYRLDDTLYRCVSDTYANYFGRIRATRGVTINEATELAKKELASDPAFIAKAGDAVEQQFMIHERATMLVGAKEKEVRAKIRKESGDKYAADLKACQDDATGRYRNRASWSVAGGAAWKNKGGGVGGEEFDGGSLWTSLKLPFTAIMSQRLDEDEASRNYVIGFARYDFDKKAEVTGGTQEYDKVTGAVVAGFLPFEEMKIAFEGGYEWLNYKRGGPLKDHESGFYAATVTLPVPQVSGMWLEVKAGASKSNPAAPGDNDTKVTFSFRYAPPQK